MNPFLKFEEWYKQESSKTFVRIPSACCLSTIGLDGYPNARFLSLKTVENSSFIITGPTNSRKGLELEAIPKAALTFWWTETERQVRIQGNAFPLEDELAYKFFRERNKDSQLISMIFDQGKEVANHDDLSLAFKEAQKKYHDQEVPRPENWGGFRITPIRIEFLEFDQSRLHKRLLFFKEETEWKSVSLQP